MSLDELKFSANVAETETLPTGRYAFVLMDKGQLVVAIHGDGAITYGPAFTTTDVAAKAFWGAIAVNRPGDEK